VVDALDDPVDVTVSDPTAIRINHARLVAAPALKALDPRSSRVGAAEEDHSNFAQWPAGQRVVTEWSGFFLTWQPLALILAKSAVAECSRVPGADRV
jgi:hypothetical protein